MVASVLGLFERSGVVKVEDVLQDHVPAECHPIFNTNRAIRKTQKSKLQKN